MVSRALNPTAHAALDFATGFETVGEAVPMPKGKRIIDVLLSGIGLTVLSPLILLVALAVVIDSRGAPFFRQTRVGRGGKTFIFWKFRSMRANAEELKATLSEDNEADGHIFKMKSDPRITKVGRLLRKSSMDELPQLWNVLKGDMSLVGPRPPTAEEVGNYEPFELRRLAAVPGITGLWQVTARERHDFQDMVRLDIDYAERMSLFLDIQILLKTVPVVLTGRGAY